MALTLRSKGPEICFWERGDEGESLEQAGPWLPPARRALQAKTRASELLQPPEDATCRPGVEAGDSSAKAPGD